MIQEGWRAAREGRHKSQTTRMKQPYPKVAQKSYRLWLGGCCQGGTGHSHETGTHGGADTCTSSSTRHHRPGPFLQRLVCQPPPPMKVSSAHGGLQLPIHNVCYPFHKATTAAIIRQPPQGFQTQEIAFSQEVDVLPSSNPLQPLSVCWLTRPSAHSSTAAAQ